MDAYHTQLTFGLEPWPHQSPKPVFQACDAINQGSILRQSQHRAVQRFEGG